ncbi:MAG: caspase family protein [Kofleriaceae bacterium]
MAFDLIEIVDRRAIAGAAATHALVIGVSHYRHFDGGADPTPTGQQWGMRQLTAAAGSATAVAAWLATDYRNKRAPLGSLRVLVSPRPDDTLDPLIAPHVANNTATRANVETALDELFAACKSNPDSVAIVYIAGHGVQMTRDGAVVLLEDAGDGNEIAALRGAIDAMACRNGMNRAASANTQFWFIDACREEASYQKQFEYMAGALEIDAPKTPFAQSSHCFLAASTGQQAFARPKGRTLFCEALLESLRTALVGPGPGCSSWHVSSQTLGAALQDRVRTLAAEKRAIQNVFPLTSGMQNVVFHQIDGTPEVEVTIAIDPEEAAATSRGELALNGEAKRAVVLEGPWPAKTRVEQGLYILRVTSRSTYRERVQPIAVNPPSVVLAVALEKDSR